MSVEKYEVRNRYTGAVQFTAEVECAPDTPSCVKLGLAVRWGFTNKANLYGADLRGADLYGAGLRGADLYGADLRGAKLSDKKINRTLASVSRINDGFTFNLFEMQDGPPKVNAGCRFLTIADYRAHVAREYPDTPKARETLRILDFFDATVAAECAAPAEPSLVQSQS